MKEAIELMKKQGFNNDMGLLVRTPTTAERMLHMFIRTEVVEVKVYEYF